MSPNALQEIAQTLDKVAEAIWDCDDLEDVFDDLLQRVSRLEAQLHVQRSLQRTAKLLRVQPRDTALPKQMATRVKHFISFTYEETNRGKTRPTRLRELECNTLKFCGLAYKVKDVVELPATQFDFLVTKAGDFVHRQDLSQNLYRDEIDKAVNSKFDPEDDAIFKEFLKSHVDQRPAKRKRHDGVPSFASQKNMVDSDGQRIEAEKDQQPGESRLKQTDAVPAAEQRMAKAPSPTRPTEHYHAAGPRIYNQHREIEYMCTNALASDISKLPEPFKTNLQNSHQWKWERSQELETTGCLTTLFPKSNEHDVTVSMFVGHKDGYELNKFFGLQLATAS